MNTASSVTESHNDDVSDASKAARKRRKEIYILLAALLLAGVLLVVVYAIWNYDRHHPITDDAFLQANHVWIKPQVTGQIKQVFVRPDAYVQAGEPLFEIDPAPFQQRLTRAQKQLLLTAQQNVSDKASIEAFKAQIEEQQAVIKTAEQFAASYKKMEKEGAASHLGALSYADVLATAKAKLLELKADLARAMAQLGDEDIQQARIDAAQVEVELAILELQWTRVVAPADGSVSGFTLRAGDVVEPGQQLFPFIEADEWWVQANFKETAIAAVRPGMPAIITIDSYGSREFKGTVESIAARTAAAFSLLPAQNTTGNWVKVTQRIPVRIRMQTPQPDFPFRFGASVVAKVYTETAPNSSAADNNTPPSP
jgi:membrane fusion protein (multidrug efflux system)